MKFGTEAYLALLALAAMVGPSESMWPIRNPWIDWQLVDDIKKMIQQFGKELHTHDQHVEHVAGEQFSKLKNLRTKFGLLWANKPDTSGILNELEGMKTVLNQKSNSVKELQNNNADSTKTIRKSIQSLPTNLAKLIQGEVAKLKPHDNGQHHQDRNAKLDQLVKKLARIEQVTVSDLNSMNDDVNVLKESLSKGAIKAECFSESNLLSQYMNDTENLFLKYETKLNDFEVYGNNVQNEFVKLQDKSRATEECHNNLLSVLKKEGTTLQDIEKSFTTTRVMMKDLVTKQSIYDAIDRAQYVQENAKKGVANIISRLDELSTKQTNLHAMLSDSMSVTDKLTEKMYKNVSQNNVRTRDKIDVLSTILNVNIITPQETNIKSVLKQFQDIKLSLLQEVQNQNTKFQGALGTTLRNEMSKVQQDLGIVKEQLTTDQEALEELVRLNCIHE